MSRCAKDSCFVSDVIAGFAQLTAPECSFPDLTYDFKWFATMSVPLIAGTLFMVFHFLVYLWKHCVLGQDKKAGRKHTAQLIGIFFTMFYYMYLFLVRFALDVFNCNSTTPPDGKVYMQAEFVECWVPGGLQARLFPWAVLAFIGYGLAYPGLVLWVLWQGRELAKEDQLLRAQRIGDTPATNPNAFDFRLKYHKLCT